MLYARVERTVDRAQALAARRRHSQATLLHLLLALTENVAAQAVLEACRVDPQRLCGALEKHLDKEPARAGAAGHPETSEAVRRVLQRAAAYVQSHGGEEVTGANLLVALYGERESRAVQALKNLGMTRLDAVNFVARGVIKGVEAAPLPGTEVRERAASELDYWIRRSPYFEASRRAGARHFAVANHMYQPSGYADPVAEYWNLVEGVTLWDVATERQVEVAGRDALAFAELLTPRDLSKLPVGRCRYVVVTSEEGGIVNDPVLLRLAEDRFWFSTSDSDLLLWAKGVAVHAGLEVAIGEPDVSPLQVQGPKSPAVIEALFGPEIAGLGYYRLAETELEGIPLVVTRTGWSGEAGYEIFLRDSASAETLWERVLEAGRPQGIAVTGPSDIRRVEAGILGYGCDIGLDTNPFEADLERLVELDKEAPFIGKAALTRIAKAGATRRLVGIEITGAPLAAPFAQPWPVLGEDGAQVGKVTVALHSPRLNRNIGYAMVPVGQSAPGTKLAVAAPWGEAEAIVAEKPFVKASR